MRFWDIPGMAIGTVFGVQRVVLLMDQKKQEHEVVTKRSRQCSTKKREGTKNE